MAIATGRAGRSAVGTFGCYEGGFLVDRGKGPNDNVAPIDLRIDFPEHWPIALVYPQQTNALVSTAAGMHGAQEVNAFKKIPPTSPSRLKEMRSLVKNRIVPSLINEDYRKFGNALQTFGRRSGDYFKSIQGGTFADSRIEEIVNLIDQAGVPAVGQTSWGPCVFAIAPNMDRLKRSTDAVSKAFGDDVTIEHTRADNNGATITKT
jgi:beta-RFAP synthase